MMGENKKSFSITGMSCITCANAVEKSLKEIRKAVEKVGYGISTEPPEDLEKKRYQIAKKNLLFSYIITIPLSILMIFNMIGYRIPYFVWIELFFGGIVIFYSGKDVFKGAWIER